MTTDIYDRDGNLLHASRFDGLRAAVEDAASRGISLQWADLRGADLSSAYLAGVNLSRAYLNNANLSRAQLQDANLNGAYLTGADLTYAGAISASLVDANLVRANLSSATLQSANLAYARLFGADLSRANFDDANLAHASLIEANAANASFEGANLRHAELVWIKNLNPRTAAELLVPPAEGAFTAWKKAQLGSIVKLTIPAHAQRSNATSRKCRASEAYVEAIYDEYGAPVSSACSLHDPYFIYHVGAIVTPRVKGFEPDRWQECAPGIHFFITRSEAEAY
ncbi:pentapeptide repeat protein [Mycobacterium phage Inca]|nr:pentapeptide repeat protein [Mycobacterium phage Inca]QGJ96218.1 pentapeptide repeat protein [Mycobacterium phage Myrale]WNO28020.1 pentapeptide repeat protein [Mycobacterium phage Marshmallow]